MSGQKKLVIFGLAATAFGLVNSGCGRALAQQSIPLESDRNIALTVYKEDFAMVSEKRPIDLPDGHRRVSIDDVSKQLDPESILFDWPQSSQKPRVVATTYDLGVGNGANLLRRLNGKQVDMMWPSNDGKPGETVTGRLEAADQGDSFALRTNDKLYVNPGGTIVASSSSAASTLPQLSVELDCNSVGKTQLGLSYLTRGMSWSADYVAKLDPALDQVEFECWATIKNTTGLTFPSAKLTLMAGSPNRSVQSAQDRAGFSGGGEAQAPMATLSMDRSGALEMGRHRVAYGAVGDIYAYKVPSTATIGQDQMNRVSVLGTCEVPIKRDYAVRLSPISYWGYEGDYESQNHIPATLSISFVNDKDSHLGIPLPAGDVKVYDADSDGNAILTGAATIRDTTKNEHVNLTLSNVFDVYCEYKIVRSERIDKHTVRKTVQATLHNEKRKSIDLRLVQSIYGSWKPVKESSPSKKLDSNDIQWIIPMESSSEKKLIYSIDFRI